jgi:hypothetical protein
LKLDFTSKHKRRVDFSFFFFSFDVNRRPALILNAFLRKRKKERKKHWFPVQVFMILHVYRSQNNGGQMLRLGERQVLSKVIVGVLFGH